MKVLLAAIIGGIVSSALGRYLRWNRRTYYPRMRERAVVDMATAEHLRRLAEGKED